VACSRSRPQIKKSDASRAKIITHLLDVVCAAPKDKGVESSTVLVSSTDSVPAILEGLMRRGLSLESRQPLGYSATGGFV
jgi:hypothetical protein